VVVINARLCGRCATRCAAPTGLLNALLALLSEVGCGSARTRSRSSARPRRSPARSRLSTFVALSCPSFQMGFTPRRRLAVETYIVGLHTVHLAKLKPELDDDEILTFDLDTATLRRARAAKRLSAVPSGSDCVVEISRLLLHAVGGGNDALSTISGSLKGVGDSLSAPFGARGPFGLFGAGARPSANKGENNGGQPQGPSAFRLGRRFDRRA
jgi:hypothetical protein